MVWFWTEYIRIRGVSPERGKQQAFFVFPCCGAHGSGTKIVRRVRFTFAFSRLSTRISSDCFAPSFRTALRLQIPQRRGDRHGRVLTRLEQRTRLGQPPLGIAPTRARQNPRRTSSYHRRRPDVALGAMVAGLPRTRQRRHDHHPARPYQLPSRPSRFSGAPRLATLGNGRRVAEWWSRGLATIHVSTLHSRSFPHTDRLAAMLAASRRDNTWNSYGGKVLRFCQLLPPPRRRAFIE